MSAPPVGPGWRADVRNVVSDILSKRIPAVKGRVHRARVWPTTAKPALLVYGYAEKKELQNQGGYQHQFAVACNMVIRVLCEGAATLNLALDVERQCEALAGEVERTILRSPELFAPVGGILTRCASVETQIEAAQKEKRVEVEATIQFQLLWDEVFTMDEPEATPCEGVIYTPQPTLLTPTTP